MTMRPSSGTITGRVWEIGDSLSARLNRMALRREVIEAAEAEGISRATANTQYGHWKRATFPNATGALKRRVTPSGEKPAKSGSASRELSERDWGWLLRNGFTYAADWVFGDSGALVLDRPAPDEPGVYVFVRHDEIVYVGVTTRPLAKRMDDYRRGHIRQRTSARVKELIGETLSSGGVVRVLFATPEASEWNGFAVNTALGLESELIRAFRPHWNLQGLRA